MVYNNSLFSLPEEKKIRNMRLYEDDIAQKGFKYIAGLDEVGRGPIAGPVVVAAVILPEGYNLQDADDSKKLTARKRERLAEQIKKDAVAWSMAYIFPPYLDQVNILNATKEAMVLAVKHLDPEPDYLLIDALKLEDISTRQQAIIKGDSLSISIACASIIAKVERDRAMLEFDALYPGYNFSRHKGYATKEHIQRLLELGPTKIHRASFEPVKSILSGGNNAEQPGLFGPDDTKPDCTGAERTQS